MYDWVVLWEWVAIAARWTHVITAVAWIGSSFYFIALDLGLTRDEMMAAVYATCAANGMETGAHLRLMATISATARSTMPPAPPRWSRWPKPTARPGHRAEVWCSLR